MIENKYIQKELDTKNVVVIMKFGSHLYGTNTPDSDTDYKGVYIPELDDVIMGNIPRASETLSTGKNDSKNTDEDIDLEMFHLKGFLKLCEEGQVCALDMLFAPDDMIIYKSSVWDELIKNRDKLLHKKVTAFIGYCRKQTAKYGIKGSRLDAIEFALNGLEDETGTLKNYSDGVDVIIEKFPEFFSINQLEKPSKNIGGGGVKDPLVDTYLEFANRKFMMNSKASEMVKVLKKIKKQYGDRAKLAQTNEGVDWKAVSHAVRVCYQAIELLETGHITMPLKSAPLVTMIKQGKAPYLEVAELLESLMDDVTALKEISKLPEEPDTQWMKEFCINSYMGSYVWV